MFIEVGACLQVGSREKALLKIINNVTDAIEIIRGLRNF